MSKRVTVIVEGREYIVEVGDLNDSPIKATVNQRTYQVEVPRQSTQPTVPDTPVAAPVPGVARAAQSAPSPANSAITAPMPGNVVEVKVKAGDRVQSQDVICVLDAMKMNNMIYTDRPGVIATVDVVAGQAVDYGAVLVTFQ